MRIKMKLEDEVKKWNAMFKKTQTTAPAPTIAAKGGNAVSA
jgi:hypothetical protein